MVYFNTPLKYPNQLLVSVESGVVKSKISMFTRDILNSYSEWRLRALTSYFISNHCVWGNKDITGLWNKVLWNGGLIGKGVIYISNFLSDLPSRNRIVQ